MGMDWAPAFGLGGLGFSGFGVMGCTPLSNIGFWAVGSTPNGFWGFCPTRLWGCPGGLGVGVGRTPAFGLRVLGFLVFGTLGCTPKSGLGFWGFSGFYSFSNLLSLFLK